MKYIQTFESYLGGSRAPLYHGTSTYSLSSILETDMLKVNHPTRDRYGRNRYNKDQIKSISLTRDKYYCENDSIIMLDNDLLYNDGYKSHPIDELGAALPKGHKYYKKYNKHLNAFNGFKRIRHGDSVDLSKVNNLVALDEEYEERIYKNIKNLGKYIISIIFKGDNMNSQYYDFIKEYIKKYPHINVVNLKGDILFDISMVEKERELHKI